MMATETSYYRTPWGTVEPFVTTVVVDGDGDHVLLGSQEVPEGSVRVSHEDYVAFQVKLQSDYEKAVAEIVKSGEKFRKENNVVPWTVG